MRDFNTRLKTPTKSSWHRLERLLVLIIQLKFIYHPCLLTVDFILIAEPKGMYLSYQIPKDGNDRSTDLIVRTEFAGGTDVSQMNVLMFQHFRMFAEIKIHGGQIISVVPRYNLIHYININIWNFTIKCLLK